MVCGGWHRDAMAGNDAMNSDSRVWLSTKVVSVMLGMNIQNVSKRARVGQIPGAERLPSRQWRFDRDVLEPWAAARALRLAKQRDLWAARRQGRAALARMLSY